jgi:hypothetical protein
MLKFGITRIPPSMDRNYMFPYNQCPPRLLRFPMSRHLEELIIGSSSLADYNTDSLIAVLVRQCKQLQSLEFFIWVENTAGELTTAERSLSEELPNLQHLAVTLCNFRSNFRHNAIEKLDQLVTSIPNLKVLKVGTSHCGSSLVPWECFRLRSDTLETVDLVDSGKLIFFESVACPKLKLFRCRGRGCRNGVSPWYPGTHGDSRDGEFFGYTSQCSRYTIAEQSFYGMQVSWWVESSYKEDR